MDSMALVCLLFFCGLNVLCGLMLLISEHKVDRLEKELTEAREKIAALGNASSR